jgi:hypothetical protein
MVRKVPETFTTTETAKPWVTCAADSPREQLDPGRSEPEDRRKYVFAV